MPVILPPCASGAPAGRADVRSSSKYHGRLAPAGQGPLPAHRPLRGGACTGVTPHPRAGTSWSRPIRLSAPSHVLPFMRAARASWLPCRYLGIVGSVGTIARVTNFRGCYRHAGPAHSTRLPHLDHRQQALGALPAPVRGRCDRYLPEVWHHLDAAHRRPAHIPGSGAAADHADLAVD